MTGAELLTNLANRVEDTTHASFTEALKLEVLNIAQNKVMGLMDNEYLSKSHTEVKTDLTPTESSAFPDTWYISLSVSVLDKGTFLDVPNILKVWDRITNNWCRWANKDEADIYYNNAYFAVAEETEPIAWIIKENLYVRAKNRPTLDVYFVGEPDAIANNATSCDLDDLFEEPLLDLAEGQLWRMDNKPDRAQIAENNAYQLINILNSRIAAQGQFIEERKS